MTRYTRPAALALALLFTLSLASPAFADGAAVYKSKCAMCHGADGNGDTQMGRKLALRPLSAPAVQKKSDADITKLIAGGKGKMPACGTRLTAGEIESLVAVVRAFAMK